MLAEANLYIHQMLPYVKCADRYFPTAAKKRTALYTPDEPYTCTTWHSDSEQLIGSFHIIDSGRGNGYLNRFRYNKLGSLTQAQSFVIEEWVVSTNHRSRSFVIDIHPLENYDATLAMIYYLDGPDVQRIPFHRLDDLTGMNLALEPNMQGRNEYSAAIPIHFYPNDPFLFCGSQLGLTPSIDPHDDFVDLTHNQQKQVVTLDTFFWRENELLATSGQLHSVEIPIPTHAVVM